MKIALLLPHIFMNEAILSKVIFSPSQLAISLAEGLKKMGHEVTLFTPGPVKTEVLNITADLSSFEKELNLRNDSYLDLLKKHPLTFITLARQVQTQLIVDCYKKANRGDFDIVHVYANEEEIAMNMCNFCQVPLVFTHHEPFNFSAKYRSVFPQFFSLNWISLSDAQRKTYVNEANFVATIYHGLKKSLYKPCYHPEDYYLYMGRIIKPKGVHYAIQACKLAGSKLKILGKHYASEAKDKYFKNFIEPEIDGNQIQYLGFTSDIEKKNRLLAKAKALLVPSIWQEPFGLVLIEALACGTPIIGFDQGSLPEIIKPGINGFMSSYNPIDAKQKKDWQQIKKDKVFKQNVTHILKNIKKVTQIDRTNCRKDFEERFTAKIMCQNYAKVYKKIIKQSLNQP